MPYEVRRRREEKREEGSYWHPSHKTGEGTETNLKRTFPLPLRLFCPLARFLDVSRTGRTYVLLAPLLLVPLLLAELVHCYYAIHCRAHIQPDASAPSSSSFREDTRRVLGVARVTWASEQPTTHLTPLNEITRGCTHVHQAA